MKAAIIGTGARATTYIQLIKQDQFRRLDLTAICDLMPGKMDRMCLIYQAMGLKGIHVYPHWLWRTLVSGDKKYSGSEFQRDRLYHEA